jgi:tRNA threonylcarbamoyladenosine biosynthesis protein TsaE
MSKRIIREWKKVFENDLAYIVYELKELTKTPAMVVLDGELGAGKTSFVRAFVGGDLVQSPTYSIVQDYKTILHADLYRLENSSELTQLELQSMLEDKQYFFVEWGTKYTKRLFSELPEGYSSYLLEIQIVSPDSRNFTLSHLTED